MRNRSLILLSCLFVAASISPLATAAPVTTESLLAELTDLKRLASFPSPAYTSKQFSSHDPKSKTPADAKAWFANEDWDHWHGVVERNGRTERIMMKAEGPGALVRIWSANPAGTLRVYVDGNETPVLEEKMEHLLDGRVKNLPDPIAHLRSKGYNLYLPIPYAKSLEVTTDEKGFYYTVDYRTYDAGTEVTSFKAGDVARFSSQIAKQGKLLSTPRDAGVKPEKTDAFKTAISPGQTQALGTLSGSRAISRFVVRVPKGVSDQALRSAVLVMTFDGEQTVEVPLGDFFGTAPGINPYQSLPLGMTKDRELYSHWIMPFREKAEVSIKNLGVEPIELAGEIGSVAHEWTDRSLHFNAGYRATADIESQPPIDWTYLDATGKGRFVGASFTIDNPVKAWWGEGDEKFYVDGETQPSWFGTGTEDYYGYAWCWNGLFEQAYHNQPRCDGPGNYGRTSVNRYHVTDDVPFTKSFKFDMELWHWTSTRVNMTATTYWYAGPGSKDAFAVLTPEDLTVHPMPAYVPVSVAGAIEGEKMAVLKKTGHVEPQEWADTSGDYHLWWRDGRQGDQLVLGFDAPTAGKYRVIGRFLKAADYGTFTIAFNGKTAKEGLDLYNDGVVPSPEIDLGEVELKQGQNQIEVTATGTNAAGRKQHLFGLDYLLLKPVE